MSHQQSPSDPFGPEKIIEIYEPRSGLRAVVVIDNTALGPAIGGVRVAPDVDTEEVRRLARAMTLKNALAAIPHGGGKSGLVADPHRSDKPTLFRIFARTIRQLSDYIPGPDMGSDESCMACIQDEIGRAVGLPRVLGGIPLDSIGATGYGVSQAARLALPWAGPTLSGGTLVIQGFGNVGRPAADFLLRQGMRLIAVSDSAGAIHDPAGLPLDKLLQCKARGQSVVELPGAKVIATEELLALPCDLLVPAARPDVIHQGNVAQVRARVIIEGANIPVTEEAETQLHQRGVLVIPDIVANAGGVICAAVEYAGGSEREAVRRIGATLRHNTKLLLERIQSGLQPRAAALELAQQRIREAMGYRR
jgi:glutamate dehydrogenase/leucine dehydrogenase